MKHLWEYDHPYYCTEGNYYSRGHHHVFDSWAEFSEGGDLLFDGDPDLNLLFRWDWNAWHLEYPEDYKPGEEAHRLALFYMIQRKGFNLSVEISVSADDEPDVRAWLETRARTIRDVWAPIIEAEKEV